MKTILITGLAALGIALAPTATADEDCYTQTSYNGDTRITCYTGYPSYETIITVCDERSCKTRSN